MWAVWGLAGGLQAMVETLAQSLVDRGVEIRTGETISSIEKSEKSVILVSDHANIMCDHLILATPSHVSASLLQSLSADLSLTLASIPFVSVALVNLEYYGRDL